MPTEKPEAETSISLMMRVRRDPADVEAWEEFVRRYQPMIREWCLRWGARPDDADDVVQEVLLKLLAAMKSFDYDPVRSFRAWLKTVTQNAWNDYVRSHRRESTEDPEWFRALLDSRAAIDDLSADGRRLRPRVARDRHATRGEAGQAGELAGLPPDGYRPARGCRRRAGTRHDGRPGLHRQAPCPADDRRGDAPAQQGTELRSSAYRSPPAPLIPHRSSSRRRRLAPRTRVIAGSSYGQINIKRDIPARPTFSFPEVSPPSPDPSSPPGSSNSLSSHDGLGYRGIRSPRSLALPSTASNTAVARAAVAATQSRRTQQHSVEQPPLAPQALVGHPSTASRYVANCIHSHGRRSGWCRSARPGPYGNNRRYLLRASVGSANGPWKIAVVRHRDLPSRLISLPVGRIYGSSRNSSSDGDRRGWLRRCSCPWPCGPSHQRVSGTRW